MEKRIKEITEKICCRKIEKDEELLQSNILDSFKVMELICELENEFQIEFIPEEIMEMSNFVCVKNIISCLKKKIS